MSRSFIKDGRYNQSSFSSETAYFQGVLSADQGTLPEMARALDSQLGHGDDEYSVLSEPVNILDRSPRYDAQSHLL